MGRALRAERRQPGCDARARGAGPAPSLPAGPHYQPHRAAFTNPPPSRYDPQSPRSPPAPAPAPSRRSPVRARGPPRGPAASPGPVGPPPRGGLPVPAPAAGRRRSAPLSSRPPAPSLAPPPWRRAGRGRHSLSIAGGGGVGGRRGPAGGAGSAVSAPSSAGRGRRRCRLPCVPRTQRPGLPAGQRPAAAAPWPPDTRRGGAGASGAGEARAQAPSGRQWEPAAPRRLPALGARLAGPGGAEAAWDGRPAACGAASAARGLGSCGAGAAGRFSQLRFFSVRPRGPVRCPHGGRLLRGSPEAEERQDPLGGQAETRSLRVDLPPVLSPQQGAGKRGLVANPGRTSVPSGDRDGADPGGVNNLGGSVVA